MGRSPQRSSAVLRSEDGLTESLKGADALRERIAELESALRVIGTTEHVPKGFDPLDWWQFKACKRGEIARDALGVTAEDLIRAQWEAGVA